MQLSDHLQTLKQNGKHIARNYVIFLLIGLPYLII